MDQCATRSHAATNAKPQTGVVSATTTDISNSGKTHGNEGQDMAALVAGHCVHGRKSTRIGPECLMRARSWQLAPNQRASSHIRITRITRAASTSVTRDRGI